MCAQSGTAWEECQCVLDNRIASKPKLMTSGKHFYLVDSNHFLQLEYLNSRTQICFQNNLKSRG